MSGRLAAAVALALLICGVVAFVVTPHADVQEPPSPPANLTYDYDVLPGIQPYYETNSSLDHFHNVRLTCGWHTKACLEYNPDIPGLTIDGEGLDISVGVNTLVYAVFRARQADPRFTALVSAAGYPAGYGECMKVVVEVTDENSNVIAEVSYTHTEKLSSAPVSTTLNMPTSDGYYGVTKVAKVTGSDLECPYDPHLHQWLVKRSAASSTTYPGVYLNRTDEQAWWQEIDLRRGTILGDGFPKGWHPDPPGSRRRATHAMSYAHHLSRVQINKITPSHPEYDADFYAKFISPLSAYPVFCSDTRLFSIRTPGFVPPTATNVEPCRPAGLAARGEPGQLTVSWDDPGDSTISGYELRHKTVNENWPAASGWAPVGKVYTHTRSRGCRWTVITTWSCEP